MHVVYILRCNDGTLYTGAAKDLDRRLAQHAAGRASRYTRSRLPVVLLWSRRVRTWGDALKTEYWIKTLTRDEKNALVGGARMRRPPRPRRRASAVAGAGGGDRRNGTRRRGGDA